MDVVFLRARAGLTVMLAVIAIALLSSVSQAYAQVTAFRQAIAEAAAEDEALSVFYRT